MPSKSEAQHNLMEGVAHDPAFAKRVGIPQSVGQEFVDADEAKAKTKPKHKAGQPHIHDALVKALLGK